MVVVVVVVGVQVQILLVESGHVAFPTTNVAKCGIILLTTEETSFTFCLTERRSVLFAVKLAST